MSALCYSQWKLIRSSCWRFRSRQHSSGSWRRAAAGSSVRCSGVRRCIHSAACAACQEGLCSPLHCRPRHTHSAVTLTFVGLSPKSALNLVPVSAGTHQRESGTARAGGAAVRQAGGGRRHDAGRSQVHHRAPQGSRLPACHCPGAMTLGCSCYAVRPMHRVNRARPLSPAASALAVRVRAYTALQLTGSQSVTG